MREVPEASIGSSVAIVGLWMSEISLSGLCFLYSIIDVGDPRQAFYAVTLCHFHISLNCEDMKNTRIVAVMVITFDRQEERDSMVPRRLTRKDILLVHSSCIVICLAVF